MVEGVYKYLKVWFAGSAGQTRRTLAVKHLTIAKSGHCILAVGVLSAGLENWTRLCSLAPVVLNAALHRHRHSLAGLEEPGLCPQPSAGRRGLPPPQAEKTAQLGPWLSEPLSKALHMQSPSLRSWDRPWHSPTKPCAPEQGEERKTWGPKRGVPSQSSAAVFPRGSLFPLYLCPWDPAA